MAESPSPLSPAFDALRNGDLARAQAICEQVLEQESDNAKAWHVCGIVHAQQNDLDRAVECLSKAIELRGDIANYHYNLGLAYQSLRDFDRAIDAYRAAVEIKSDFVEAQNNLGNCLIETDDLTAAVDHFRMLVAQFPEESIAHYNLANVLQDAGEYGDSITEFRRAVELDPDFATARENLGRALSDVTRYDEAIEVWREWLDHDPDSAVAQHMLASTTGDNAPDRCGDDYVRATFDHDFARSYENQLERIGYRVPDLIREAIESLGIERDDLDVLDAGCGTGLCADALRPLAGNLVGVDLSGDMLAEADKRKTYDELHEHELVDYLQSCQRQCDLIVCGDTLCYFGALDAVLAGAAKCLHQGGHFVFTVESDQRDDDGDSDDGERSYELQPHGRYRHAESYLRVAIAAAGLSTVTLSTGTLRRERGREVEGFVVIAKR